MSERKINSTTKIVKVTYFSSVNSHFSTAIALTPRSQFTHVVKRVFVRQRPPSRPRLICTSTTNEKCIQVESYDLPRHWPNDQLSIHFLIFLVFGLSFFGLPYVVRFHSLSLDQISNQFLFLSDIVFLKYLIFFDFRTFGPLKSYFWRHYYYPALWSISEGGNTIKRFIGISD